MTIEDAQKLVESAKSGLTRIEQLKADLSGFIESRARKGYESYKVLTCQKGTPFEDEDDKPALELTDYEKSIESELKLTFPDFEFEWNLVLNGSKGRYYWHWSLWICWKKD